MVRGGEVVSLEGPKDTRRVVVIEFPSLEQARNFYYSDEYKKAISLQSDIANFEMMAVDGIN